MVYIVPMKQVTASEARKNWFRLLDEVVDGEVVSIPRKGKSVLIKLDEKKDIKLGQIAMDYRDVVQASNVNDADRWHWQWDEEGALDLVVDEDS